MLSKDKGEKDLHAMATSNVEEESISQVPASGYGDMASVNTADEAYFFTGSSTVLSLMNHRPKPVAPVQVLLPDGKVHLGLATHTVGLGENVDNSTEQEINSLPEDTVLVGIQRARALGKAKFFRVKSLFVFFAVIHVASLCVAIVGSQKPSAIIKSPHMTRSVPSVNMIEPAVSISIVISLIMAVVGCFAVWFENVHVLTIFIIVEGVTFLCRFLVASNYTNVVPQLLVLIIGWRLRNMLNISWFGMSDW